MMAQKNVCLAAVPGGSQKRLLPARRQPLPEPNTRRVGEEKALRREAHKEVRCRLRVAGEGCCDEKEKFPRAEGLTCSVLVPFVSNNVLTVRRLRWTARMLLMTAQWPGRLDGLSRP